MPKISIIVPVYNVEYYIEKCARSLFEQTLDDIEYIFVDDCSPDNSIQVLRDVIASYPNRTLHVNILHHQSNMGLPAARRSGLHCASGDFILHCDSDDWLLPETCEELYKVAVRDSLDVVIFDLWRTDGIYIKAANTGNVEQVTLDMMYMRSAWSVVNKMFKRSVYDTVELYPMHNVGEDMALCLQLIYGCRKMTYIPKPFYQYFINPSSMSNSITTDKAYRRYLDGKANVDLIVEFYKDKPISKEVADALSYVKWSARKILWGVTYDGHYRKIWKDTYPEIWPSILFDRNFRMREKIKALLTYLAIAPWGTDRITNR